MTEPLGSNTGSQQPEAAPPSAEPTAAVFRSISRTRHRRQPQQKHCRRQSQGPSFHPQIAGRMQPNARQPRLLSIHRSLVFRQR